MKERSNIWFYIKHFNIHSIFLRNFLIIVCLMILPVVGISTAVYIVYDKIIREEIGTVHHIALSRLRDMIDMAVREVDEFALHIASDQAAGRFLSESRPDRAEPALYTQMNQLRQKMMPVYKLSGQFINSVYLYSDASGFVQSTNLGLWDAQWFTDSSWIAEYERRKTTSNFWLSARTAKQYVGEQTERHFLSFFYTAPLDVKNRQGAIVVNVDTDRLDKFINNVGDPYLEDIYITDKSGTVLYNRDLSMINRRLTDSLSTNDNKKSIASLDSQYNDWTFYSILPLQAYQEKNAYLRRYVLVIFAAGLAVALLLALIIASKVFQPIRKIISIVENPDKWMTVELERQEPHLNEIRQIASTLIRSHDERLELEQELRKRLTLLKQAQSIALQSQINPHFLYNTLETINWNALRLTGGENKVSEMISSLSKLLRLSLETPVNLIPVQTELEHVRHYIDLVSVRYKTAFSVVWDVDESIRQCRIPKITLQPLVENAISHGIKPKGEKGVIRISGRKRDGCLLFEIADDGVGIGRERTEELNAAFKDDYSEPGDHIGIRNVNQRIKLTFGESYGLIVSSEPGLGTVVQFTIPVLE
ncbi:sensor histidine kinase [Paenibacillus mesophilus]|uniref:sensor histidine kinase n=1 Tax=Paenibacillus mesophilus TaxID=2582849 RepID=UPI00110F371B|nr:sensor histidine kinase [Paenibacillus mesophilus]TMV46272.1 sensor histidine kinase [Paenibacillus mesophilus]